MAGRVEPILVAVEHGRSAADRQAREAIDGIVTVTAHHAIRQGHTLQVAHGVVAVAGGLRVGSSHRVEPVQLVVGVSHLRALGRAAGDAQEIAGGVIAIAERALRRGFARQPVPRVVTVDRLAAGIEHPLAPAARGVTPFGVLTRRPCGQAEAQAIERVVAVFRGAPVEVGAEAQIPRAVVLHRLALRAGERARQPPAERVVAVAGRMLVRIGLVELVAQLIVAVAGDLAEGIDHRRQPAQLVIDKALRLAALIGLARAPAEFIVGRRSFGGGDLPLGVVEEAQITRVIVFAITRLRERVNVGVGESARCRHEQAPQVKPRGQRCEEAMGWKRKREAHEGVSSRSSPSFQISESVPVFVPPRKLPKIAFTQDPIHQ